MSTSSTRLLRLISLLQTRRYWSGQDLCERLGVDKRTVRRDIDKLRSLGYPVQASSGLGGGYQLGAGAEMPPMLLDDDEAVTMAVALRAAAGSVGKLDDTALRLLSKLDQLLPARLRRRASALHAVTLTLSMSEAPLPDADLLTRIATACRDHECLRFAYRRHDGDGGNRHVEPLRLANAGRRWYLVAWDLQRDDWRTFRVDRIAAPLEAGLRFTPREPPENFAAFVARAIRYAPSRHHVRLQLRGSAQENAARIPSWCGVLEAVDEHHCLLDIGAESAESLVAQMLIPGLDFEVIETDAAMLPELRRVSERLRRALGDAP